MQAPYDQSSLVPFHFALFLSPSLRIPCSFQVPEVTSNFANTEQKENVSLGKSEMTNLSHTLLPTRQQAAQTRRPPLH